MLRIVACDSRRGDDDALKIAAQERDAGAFDRDVGAGSHRDADVGRGKRRRVVHPVAGHGDDPPLLAQAFDRFALVLRQDFRLDLRDAELARDRFGGRAIVAGQHHDADARVALSARTASGGRRLDRDRRRRSRRHALPSIAAKIAVAPSLRRSSAAASSAADVDARRLHHEPVAERDLASVDGSGHALAGGRIEAFDLGEREVAVRRRAHDRRRQRMLARPVRGSPRAAATRPRPDRRRRCTATTLGLPSVSVPVLSTTSVSTFSNRSKRLGVLDQHARTARRVRRRP